MTLNECRRLAQLLLNQNRGNAIELESTVHSKSISPCIMYIISMGASQTSSMILSHRCVFRPMQNTARFVSAFMCPGPAFISAYLRQACIFLGSKAALKKIARTYFLHFEVRRDKQYSQLVRSYFSVADAGYRLILVVSSRYRKHTVNIPYRARQ